MSQDNDQVYFEWLVAQIEIGKKNKTYRDLFEKMHNVEFVWTVPNDDNRVHDALDLRSEFMIGMHGMTTEKVMNLDVMTGKGATLLEVLVSLSRHCANTAGGDPEWWAWHLMENLKLHKLSDPLTRDKDEKAEEIFYTLIWRTYQRDGRGGFFPLVEPHEDQRKVEIWFQMNKYIREIDRSYR